MKKICVIGSGVMGAGIAAQIANSEHNVLLLDIVNPALNNRNELPLCAKQNLLTRKPTPISHPKKLDYIEIGNIEDDLYKITECDWVIEVVLEKLEVKRDLYNKILPYLQENAILSSNTSTIPLIELKKTLPRDIQERFFITHFFNPPRYMRLVELITDGANNPLSVERITKFITKELGKTVIPCNDTPGFIANRIGCFLLEHALRCAKEFKIDVEVIDYIFHKYLSMPRTGIFGLMDLIGLDLMPLITRSMMDLLPPTDRLYHIYYEIPELTALIKQGYNGKKGKGGFFKAKEALDLISFTYRPVKLISDMKYKNINDIISENSDLGQCITKILNEFTIYIANLIPSVSDNIYDIDRAIQLGYNWKYGPFEMVVRLLGTEYFKTSTKEYMDVPQYITEQKYKQIDLKNFALSINYLSKKQGIITLKTNDSVNLLQLDEVFCLEIKTKMGVLNHDIFNMILDAITIAEDEKKPLLIYNDELYFSAGADLKLFAEYIKSEKFDEIEEFLKLGQKAMMRMKYSNIPVISCVKGFALGGGCELLLHSSGVVAHLDSSCGLVELSVGLIPGWGGLKEMIVRGCDFDSLIFSTKTQSADYLQAVYKIRDLKINMNHELMFQQAKKFASIIMNDKKHYLHDKEYTIPAAIFDKYNTAEMAPHISKIIKMMKSEFKVPMTEEQLLDMERKIFLNLVKDPETLALISNVK
jgi:3-hydroxyacyl-CoA dehydrogenase/enoyl-CoA hydratase/3-hydroxybutyryl-CoA epimerase